MRIVHYINQFYAGIGGEDAADTPPERRDGPLGPGGLLSSLVSGAGHEVVATVICGDDHSASNAEAIPQILELVRDAGADLLVAGPAFGSGRYGYTCARLVAAANAAGLPAIAAMHDENPGVDEAGTAPVVASGGTAREMKPSMEKLAAAVLVLAAGEPITTDHGRISRIPRATVTDDRRAAARAVDLIVARIGGDRDATEIPATGFDVITPAAPVEKVSAATIAFATEGGLVPTGNPDRLESARVTKWLQYAIDGIDGFAPGEWVSVDGGFSPVAADADPNRIIPLDGARSLERDGEVGAIHDRFLVTVGNGAPVSTGRRFGIEWAAELHRANVHAAILTAT